MSLIFMPPPLPGPVTFASDSAAGSMMFIHIHASFIKKIKHVKCINLNQKKPVRQTLT